MQEQTALRQPDETICFRCGSIVKRDAGLCPQCGSRIAAGPEHAVAPMSPVRGSQAGRPAQIAQTPTDGGGYAVDTIGPGRYIVNFLLAGLIGLGLSYFLRREGWLATYISIPIGIIAVLLYAATMR